MLFTHDLPKRLAAGLGLVASLLLGTGSALAAPVTDQVNLPNLTAAPMSVARTYGGQTFTAAWSGPLEGVWLAAACDACTGSIWLETDELHPGGAAGAFAYSLLGGGTWVPASTWAGGNSSNLQYVPFTDSPALEQGTTYAVLVGASNAGGSGFRYVVTSGDHYQPGQFMTLQWYGGCGGIRCLIAPTGTAASQDAVFLMQMGDSTRHVNDTDAGLQYSGAGWGYYPGRPGSFQDLQNDVHATLTNGDAVSYTFTGTGIAYVSEKSDGYGLVDVYLDGQFQQTVDANAAGVHNQGNQVLLSQDRPRGWPAHAQAGQEEWRLSAAGRAGRQFLSTRSSPVTDRGTMTRSVTSCVR